MVYIGYWKNALSHGVKIFLNKTVDKLKFDETKKIWTVENIQSKYVINCGGLWGDDVEKNANGFSKFQIKPKKGEFIVFEKVHQEEFPEGWITLICLGKILKKYF